MTKALPSNSIPVTIRGKSYQSVSAAARDLGLHPTSVMRALKENRLEKIGLDDNPKPDPVIIDGKHYPSQGQAARAVGISQSALSRAIDKARKNGWERIAVKNHSVRPTTQGE